MAISVNKTQMVNRAVKKSYSSAQIQRENRRSKVNATRNSQERWRNIVHTPVDWVFVTKQLGEKRAGRQKNDGPKAVVRGFSLNLQIEARRRCIARHSRSRLRR